MDEIIDIEQIEKKLANLPDEVFQLMVVRSALRALTGFVNLSDASIEEAREHWVGSPNLTTFSALRAALSTVNVLIYPTKQMKRVAVASAEWAEAAPVAKGVHPGYCAAGAARAVSETADNRPESYRFVYDNYSHQDIGYVYLARDIDKFENFTDSTNILCFPIWIGEEPKGAISNSNALFKGLYPEGIPEKWDFWREWYQGFLIGKPIDWDLQKEIALIPDEDWKKGPEWIARLIEIIRKRRDLEATITAVKEEITVQRATITHRSHNQPPEMVDEVPQQLTIIWDHLGEIEEEIVKEKPTVDVLRKLLARTLAYAKAIGLYCASLGDAALKKAAEEIGSTGAKWVVRMTAAYFAVQAPPVQSGLQKIGALLEEFIKTLH